jgi:glutamine synthetase
MKKFIAEYIWIDGQQPTAKMRSKSRVLSAREVDLEIGHHRRFQVADKTFPMWGFDGSSTNQALGHDSDCVLRPVFYCKSINPNNYLVLCDVLNTDMTPHKSNTRAKLVETSKRHKEHEMWFGLEQEYTFFKGRNPLGWPENGFPAPQGGYYCGVGADEVFGREIVEEHLQACINSGLEISGINAEVMPAQWEFQVGPLGPVEASDQLWMARYLLYKIAEKHGVSVSLDPKPVKGDWNGAGCHTNFSTHNMRKGSKSRNGKFFIEQACEALSRHTEEAISLYGDKIEERLTGKHETCSYKEFKYGVSDRGASIRIPWQVAKDSEGYAEDRRPNANCDPYLVTEYLTRIVCENEEE